MNVQNLVSMANQIGSFFEAMPDRDEATEGIATHIKKYWAPRMREALVAHWRDGDATDISPIVVESMEKHSLLLRATPMHPSEPRSDAERHILDGASES
jgi:formate dehydrogenase subunit delta